MRLNSPSWVRCLHGIAAAAFASGLLACESSSTDVLQSTTGTASGAGGATAGTTSSAGVSSSSGEGGAAPAIPCKRGIAYGYHTVPDLAALSPGIGWWYNWALDPDSESVGAAHAGLGIEYVPMVWGKGSLTDLAKLAPGDTRHMLGFNEPNFGAQANLTPTEAAAAWPEIEKYAKDHDLTLVSPAVNYCGGSCNVTDPFDWLDQFFAACPSCKVDAVAMHWYACTKDALHFYVDKFKSKYTQPLWLTEFSCLDASDTSVDVQKAYMKEALAILEDEPRVARYAWFTGRFKNTPSVDLLGADGQLTELGQQYVSFPQPCKK